MSQQSHPPLPPKQNVSKQNKKKGSKDKEGDNFDEEPLFPKYENIFHFAPKEKKTSPPIANTAPEGKPPPLLQPSSVVAGSRSQVEPNSTTENQEDVHRLRLVDMFLCFFCKL